MFRYPLKYNGVTQGFKKTNPDKHLGLDEGWNMLKGGMHVPVMAVGNGTIHLIDEQYTGGIVIIIKHNGFFSEYGHLQEGSVKVKVGQKVSMGQEIARMGSTGHYKNKKGKWVSVPNHLHYGLFKGDTFSYSLNNWVNPMDYTYLYPGQTFSKDTIKDYGNKLKYYQDTPSKGTYKTNYDMNIRKSPNGPIVKVKDCTEAMKKALTSTNPNANAVVKKGTKFTALEVVKQGESYWAKNYSGYICIKDNSKNYCTKV